MPPFSWMHSVVMCEGDLEGDAGEAILMHEKAHVLYGHSYDTLLMLAVEALQWFNPVVWMMEMDLRCIHEYQADEYVLSHGVNAKNYQLYLESLETPMPFYIGCLLYTSPSPRDS